MNDIDKKEEIEEVIEELEEETSEADNSTHEEVEKEKEWEDCAEISAKGHFFLYILFFLFVIVIIKIIYLQYAGDELRVNAEKKYYRYETVESKRGNILSANGNVIVSSVDMYKVYMDLRAKQLPQSKFDENYEALADSLSLLFGDASPAEYRERLLTWREKNFGNKLISPQGRLLDYNELKRLEQFPILDGHPYNGGAKVKLQYDRRNYYGNLAARTLGRKEALPDVRGYGIEKSYETYLEGTDGEQYMRKVYGDFWMPVEDKENREPKNGYDIVTTIDVDIQDVAESSLRNCLEEHKALSGTAVVMEVETGKIAAIANLGRNKKGDIIEDYNHAIANNVEPGSTFKLATLITLLENTSATIDTKIDTKKGVDFINGIRVSDSERGGYGVISLKTCMSKSSNIGFARIVDDHYRERAGDFIASIHKLGITKPFDFQLEGERKPIVRSDSSKVWSKADLVTMSYGYATNFTAMRTLMLYNAVANNGKLITPYIVSEIRDGDTVVESFTGEVLNEKICSDNTLRQVKEALEDVMYDGTVRNVFKGENFVVAGKTGTSLQVGDNGRYESDKGIYYLASFVGYFPADNPKYSCIVQIQTFKPRGIARHYYGSQLAAPVFKDISHNISTRASWGSESREYAAEKELELAETIKREQRSNAKYHRAVDYGDMEAVDYSSIPTRVVGNSDNITEVMDAFSLHDNQLKYSSNTDNLYIEDGVMPELKGMGLSDAIRLLEGVGIRVKATGSGVITKQSIRAGRKIEEGDSITITLSMKGVK